MGSAEGSELERETPQERDATPIEKNTDVTPVMSIGGGTGRES